MHPVIVAGTAEDIVTEVLLVLLATPMPPARLFDANPVIVAGVAIKVVDVNATEVPPTLLVAPISLFRLFDADPVIVAAGAVEVVDVSVIETPPVLL